MPFLGCFGHFQVKTKRKRGESYSFKFIRIRRKLLQCIPLDDSPVSEQLNSTSAYLLVAWFNEMLLSDGRAKLIHLTKQLLGKVSGYCGRL